MSTDKAALDNSSTEVPQSKELNITDWISDNPAAMAIYVIGCLGVGSLLGGIYLGNRAIRSFGTKNLQAMNTVLPDLKLAMKRIAHPPTQNELNDAIDESIRYQQHPEMRKDVLPLEHVLQIQSKMDNEEDIVPIYGKARRKDIKDGVNDSKTIKENSNNDSATEASTDDIIDLSTVPKTKKELEELKLKIEKAQARKYGKKIAWKAFLGGTTVSVLTFTLVGGLLCWVFDVWTFKDFTKKMKSTFSTIISSNIFVSFIESISGTTNIVSEPVSKFISARTTKTNIEENASEASKQNEKELEAAIEDLLSDILERPIVTPLVHTLSSDERAEMEKLTVEADKRIQDKVKKLLPDEFMDETVKSAPKPNLIVRGYQNMKKKLFNFGDDAETTIDSPASSQVEPTRNILDDKSTIDTISLEKQPQQVQTWSEWGWSWLTPSSYFRK